LPAPTIIVVFIHFIQLHIKIVCDVCNTKAYIDDIINDVEHSFSINVTFFEKEFKRLIVVRSRGLLYSSMKYGGFGDEQKDT
jgi:hypothetical protein